MAVKELYILRGGDLTLEKGVLISGFHNGEKMVAPITMALIVCDECNIVFDTGLHSDGIEDPSNTWGDRVLNLFPPKMTVADDIQNRLKEIGFGLDDIDYVVNSHLHFDHSGGNRLFRHSKIMVQKAEYRFACYPDAFAQGSYPKNHFDYPYLDYQLVEGDTKICDGVQVVLTKGHTVGHQSMVIDLKNTGTVILPGDAIPTKENYDNNILPGPVWSAPEAYNSILRLKNMAEMAGGTIFFLHDEEFIKKLQVSTEFFD